MIQKITIVKEIGSEGAPTGSEAAREVIGKLKQNQER